MPRHQAEAPASCQRREEQHSLHPREALADADARTSAEWEVRKLRPRLAFLGPEAFGIEPLGVGEEAQVPMRNPLAGGDDRTPRDDISADFVVGERAAPQDPRRRE